MSWKSIAPPVVTGLRSSIKASARIEMMVQLRGTPLLQARADASINQQRTDQKKFEKNSKKTLHGKKNIPVNAMRGDGWAPPSPVT